MSTHPQRDSKSLGQQKFIEYSSTSRHYWTNNRPSTIGDNDVNIGGTIKRCVFIVKKISIDLYLVKKS